jgi:hypothetical protein
MSSKGKFRFTAAEYGTHQICLTPISSGSYASRVKVYLDLQYGGVPEDNSKTDAMSGRNLLIGLTLLVSELAYRVKAIRNDLAVQRVLVFD